MADGRQGSKLQACQPVPTARSVCPFGSRQVLFRLSGLSAVLCNESSRSRRHAGARFLFSTARAPELLLPSNRPTSDERDITVSAAPDTQGEKQSFAETALRLGGKSDEEARRLGAMDKADEQVEKLFAERLRTTNSPVHRAVWDGTAPVDLFRPPPLPASAPCDAAMERSLEVVRQRREAGTLYDDQGKVSDATIDDLARAGYWGMLIGTEYGGQGAPFARYARFHTRMSTIEEMVAGMGSVHGCIGAVDPLKTFGTPEQKQRFLPRMASGEARSAFALTEPCAGSDLTALRTTAVEAGDHFEVTGEKLFITHCLPGRTIGLVVMFKGQPAVLIAELPPQETDRKSVV